MAALLVEGFEFEVDEYSIVDGERTDDFDRAGGSVVLRGSIDGVPVAATMSGASLPQALGQALALLLRASPSAGARSLSVTAYIDAETGEVTELDRVESR
ncbi:MAG TPA: hypothetical protein VHC49_15500 [Mycobacteriales bacterium]|nr:hypothetical protein [Mycobacteriales bacterium]